MAQQDSLQVGGVINGEANISDFKNQLNLPLLRAGGAVVEVDGRAWMPTLPMSIT